MHLVDQAEVERLSGDVGTQDGDVLLASDFFRRGNRGRDVTHERRTRPDADVLRLFVRDNDNTRRHRVVVVPAIRDVEEPTAADQRARAVEHFVQQNCAVRIYGEGEALVLRGTVTSPASYHGNSSVMPSSGSAMYPSSDIVMCVNTMVIACLLAQVLFP